MPPLNLFNAKVRQNEKAISRAQDEQALKNGEVSREELAQANGFFSSLNVAGASLRHNRPLSL